MPSLGEVHSNHYLLFTMWLCPIRSGHKDINQHCHWKPLRRPKGERVASQQIPTFCGGSPKYTKYRGTPQWLRLQKRAVFPQEDSYLKDTKSSGKTGISSSSHFPALFTSIVEYLSIKHDQMFQAFQTLMTVGIYSLHIPTDISAPTPAHTPTHTPYP